MSTMVAMEGLWQYLRTLPRSNKQWLSERLQEDLHPKAATTDTNYAMEYSIKTARSFEKELKRLGKRYASIADDYERLLEDLAGNPQLGTDLGRGLRKIRMAITSKGRGKSGGARVITFTVVVAIGEADINLLYIYDKAERENITMKEIETLLEKNGLAG